MVTIEVINLETILKEQKELCAKFFLNLGLDTQQELIRKHLIKKHNLIEYMYIDFSCELVADEKGIYHKVTMKSENFHGVFTINDYLDIVFENKDLVKNELKEIEQLIQQKNVVEKILDFPGFW